MEKATSWGWAVIVIIKGRGHIANFTLSRTRADAIAKWSSHYVSGGSWRKDRRAGKVRCSKIDLTEA